MTLAIIRFMTKHVSETSLWRASTPPSLTSLQKYWLTRPGALTAGLRQLGHVTLQVEREYAWGLADHEAYLAGLPAQTPAWIREVKMAINGTHAVVARSYTPLRASHGRWQGIRRLSTRPLADILYDDPRITRSAFLVARLQNRHPLFQLAAQVAADQITQRSCLPARCSVFWNNHEPLIVAECFLPEFWTMAARSAYGHRKYKIAP